MNDDDTIPLFVSPSTKKIFEYICGNPGSYIFDIGNEIEIPTMTVKRHLEKLRESGLVKLKKFKGKCIYYPDNLRDEDVEKAFSQFRHEERKMIFLFVLNNPRTTRKDINNHVMISPRQLERLIKSLEDAELIEAIMEKRTYRYSIGRVGRKIVVGSLESLAPFVDMLREKLGCDISISMETKGKTDIVKLNMINGDSITFEVGRWNMVEIDEEELIKNSDILLGEGGKDVLMAIEGECQSVKDIRLFTGKKEPVIRAKMRTLRLFGLILDFQLTDLGKKVVGKIRKFK